MVLNLLSCLILRFGGGCENAVNVLTDRRKLVGGPPILHLLHIAVDDMSRVSLYGGSTEFPLLHYTSSSTIKRVVVSGNQNYVGISDFGYGYIDYFYFVFLAFTVQSSDDQTENSVCSCHYKCL